VISIVRTGDLSGTNSVTFSTSDGTATGGAACTSGIDYISVTGQVVTFDPAETLELVNVTVCGDVIPEPGQTVNLHLTGPFTRQGTAAGTAAVPEAQNALLTINDTASQFRNANPMCITLAGTSDLYPAPITVSGAPLALGSMRVTLYDLSYTVSS